MARISYLHPGIIPLKGLILLYLRKNNLPTIDLILRDKKLIAKLGIKLKHDKIISRASENLVKKILGSPLQRNQEESVGIDTTRLNYLAKSVFINYGLTETKEYQVENNDYWKIFENKILSVPEYLKDINSKKYYRYLSDKEKRLVDDYIARKIGEFINSDDINNYCVYYWNDEKRSIETATVQINNSEKSAIIKYYRFNGNKWETKSVQRSGIKFYSSSSTIFLNFTDENSDSHHRTDICLSVHGDYKQMQYLKGSYSTSRNNADMPVAGIILFEKKGSFIDAYNAATKTIIGDKIEVPPYIYFDLMGYRFNVAETTNITDSSRLSTHEIYQILNEIKGTYVFGYLEESLKKIHKGICYIAENGRVITRIHYEKKKEIEGYVINRINFNSDIIRISNFYDHALDHSKFEYTLKIVKDDNKRVTYLEGIYSGVHDFKPKSGEIYFIKKEFETYEQLEKNTIPSKFHIINDKEYAENSDEFKLIKYLTTKNNDRKYLLFPR
ncbi:MAG: hypothetical protein JWN78_2029 [Bacteroidota bacterium]|nr:hypothetical protein [Bacteroidota bacterium]